MNPFRRKTETPGPKAVEPAEPPAPESPVSVAETDEKDPIREYEEILKKQEEYEKTRENNSRIWREMTLADLKPQVFVDCFRKLSPSEYPAELPVLMQIAASLHEIADILRSLLPQESWKDPETGGTP